MESAYFKKVIAGTIAFLVSFSLLSGCSNNNNENFITSTMTQSGSETEVSKQAENKSPLGKYTPPIDISFVRGLDDDLIINVLPKCPGETLENNRWNNRYQDELGVNIKYSWLVRGNEYSDAFTQKMNVTLASGDLPDMIFVNPIQLKQLVDADMVEDMTGYYKDYAGDKLKEYMIAESTANVDSVTFEGKMMAVPEPSSFNEYAQYIWIRNDWLKKLGLNPPKTMDELLKITEAFTTMDPDGNSKNDTFGLPVTKDLYSECMGTEGFFAGYHAYPNMWIKDSSDKLVYGSVQPQVKVALQKLADMFKAGEIDKEFGIKGTDKVAELIAAGKYGINFGQQWNAMFPLINNFNNDNNADWTGYPLVSADDQKL